MPIGAFAHAAYWRSKANLPPTPGASGAGGYVPWQTSIICAPSLFGAFQAWYEAALWAWRAWRRVRRLHGDERRLILDTVLGMLESDEYLIARQAVADTANILGFQKPTAWQSLVTVLKAHPGWTENHWRHFQTITMFDAVRPNTHGNPYKNLLVEMAYMGYALKPLRRPR